MKKKYYDLEYEIVRFEEEDIITASRCDIFQPAEPGPGCDCIGVVK